MYSRQKLAVLSCQATLQSWVCWRAGARKNYRSGGRIVLEFAVRDCCGSSLTNAAVVGLAW